MGLIMWKVINVMLLWSNCSTEQITLRLTYEFTYTRGDHPIQFIYIIKSPIFEGNRYALI